MDNISCKLCGGEAAFICTTPNEHGSVREIHSYRCKRCGLVFVGNTISNEQLKEAYGTLDHERYYSETRAEYLDKISTAVRAVLNITKERRTAKILDIGCSDGAFLLELKKRGYGALFGHELPGSDIENLEANGVIVYRDMEWQSLPTGEFDVITLLDVAEHVPNPAALFTQCYRALKRGGSLYFHTPVVTRLDRMMHFLSSAPLVNRAGRMWQRGRTSIFHLQNYTEVSLRQVLQSTGFSGLDLTVRNELSWPVQRYVRVYLCEKNGLPPQIATFLAPFFYVVLATDLFNSNKGIVVATKLS